MVVDDGDVEGQLSGVLVPELAGLELDDDVADLFGVKQQQVDEELVTVDSEVNLAADEREPRSELGQGLLQPLGQGGLNGAFPRAFAEIEEVEDIGVLDDLLRLVGVDRLEMIVEVAGSGATATRASR